MLRLTSATNKIVRISIDFRYLAALATLPLLPASRLRAPQTQPRHVLTHLTLPPWSGRVLIPASTGSPSGSHVSIYAARSPSSHHAQQIQALSSMLRAKTEAPRATQQQIKHSLIRHCCAEYVHVYTRPF